MDLGTVSFDDLFDFSPEPPPDLGENSYELEKEKIRLSGDDWSGQVQQTPKPPQHVRTITRVTTGHQVKQATVSGQEATADTIQVKTEPEVVVKQLWEEEELPETEPELGSRRGRRAGKPDIRVKLERSRQSARECRARKKLRYQYLDDMILGTASPVQPTLTLIIIIIQREREPMTSCERSC